MTVVCFIYKYKNDKNTVYFGKYIGYLSDDTELISQLKMIMMMEDVSIGILSINHDESFYEIDEEEDRKGFDFYYCESY